MKYIFALLFVLLVVNASPAMAQRVNQHASASSAAPSSADHIAAIVNDNVITTSDVEQRMKLAFLSSGLPDNPEVREHILPQILRGLIDEQLQMQEAKRLDISVSKAEIDKAMANIARDNHIPTDMRSYLIGKGASPEALEQQIRVGLSWNKVIQRELRPRVDVGDDEIESAIARIRSNSGKQEFLVSEIFLAVDSAKDEDQIKQVADRLVEQIKGGASFTAVARQFSQSTGAASGGDIGWIQEGQLSAELNHALSSMQTGQIAGPIRSSSGYHILALREKRTISLGGGGGEGTVDIQQAFRPAETPPERDAALHEAERLRMTTTDCSGLTSSERMTKNFPAWHVHGTNGVKLSQMPPWFSEKVHDLPVGKGSEPIGTNKGLLMVFVCSRHTPPDSGIDREAISTSIGTEKLELQARRLQRDLRRSAYLDVRLGKS